MNVYEYLHQMAYEIINYFLSSFHFIVFQNM